MTERSLSKGERRREQMLSMLKLQGRLSIQEMMDRFQISEATARRDLDVLERSGQLIRTLGGAQAEGFMMNHEASFNEKTQSLRLEKEAIAAKAATLIEEGDIIGLTGGTTTYLIARAIKARRNITVVTNAVNIAMELADNDQLQVVLTGGVMRSKSFELCGPLTEKIVADLNIGKMFLGIDGLTARHGITAYSELEAQIAKMLIARSNQTIAVFDHSKVGRATLFNVAPLSALHACITDARLGQELEQQLHKLRIALHVAEIPR